MDRETLRAVLARYLRHKSAPLRDRLQSGIDRVFFRTAYDFRRVVETVSERLASESDLNVITARE